MGKTGMISTPDQETQLIGELLQLSDSPLDFVMFTYPWGQKGTPLAKHSGPRMWQKEVLLEIETHIKVQRNNERQSLPLNVLQEAIASGRGIGKSALVSWLAHWMMSTRMGSSVIISANSEDQLKGVTWGEIGKWLTLAINGHWFDKYALSIRPASWFDELVRTQLMVDTTYYGTNAKLWSEENPDAFAGVHNENGVMVIFDEASGIPQPIWNVTSGFFTEPIIDRYHFAFSNGRRNTGAFFECFHANREFWKNRNIDSRTVEGTDKEVYEKIVKQHGEDSDVVRVEVRGLFPKQGEDQFISTELVDQAVNREDYTDEGAALVMGVDVARFGSDATVIRFRQGRDARSYPVFEYRGLDNMQVAARCAAMIEKYQPDAICVDAGGVGTGVVDRLKQLKYVIHEVGFGNASDEPQYLNKRAQLWGKCRDWLEGGVLPNHAELISDLTNPRYYYSGEHSDKLVLESKESMRKRGLSSPDHADALICTFAVTPARRDMRTRRKPQTRRATGIDYDIFAAY